MKTQRRTPEEIAKVFGCTESQVVAQFAKNMTGLRSMYNTAMSSGGKVNGYTAEQLSQLINNLPIPK